MKHHHQYHHDQNQHPVNAPASGAAEELKQNGADFGPSADEVAKRAYFLYVSQGSRPGHDVRDWQEAEAQLVEERQGAVSRGN